MATAGASRGSGPERAWAPALPKGGEVVLDAEESSHLVRSRRVAVGDAVVLFDGRGTCRAGVLVGGDPRAARVALEGDYPDRTPARTVRLAVSLPEMGRADRMVQALAELGVAEVGHLVCARSEPKRAGQAERRAARWEKLAREACKVNGCARALRIAPPVLFDAALAGTALLLDPDPAAPSLATAGSGSEDLTLLIGPEGGFTESEVEAARAAGAGVARVGQAALRVETAAIAAAAVVLGG
ncbi:MAG: RsmE family RNA methyltransferase [Planctomycetota bacterium]|nr:RsmE family RNA methyltransferase [Planctomycetota bacterium]